MARLVAALGFPLGGEGLSGGKPWITNMVPEPGEENVKLLRPVRLSVRDAESYIDPANILLEVGYAKVHSDGDEVFDKLPRTKRISLLPGALGIDPDIEVVEGGVKITRTLLSAQPGVYTTAVEAGPGYASAMITAVVTPGTISGATVATGGPLNLSVYPLGTGFPLPFAPLDVPASVGAVLGLEHGPRNKAAYLWFQVDGEGDRILRLTGYIPDDSTETPSPNLTTAHDWSETQRYTMVWNEAHGYLEVYADLDGETTRVFRTTIAGLPEMPDDYFARAGEVADVVGLYGQEGSEGDFSTWSNVAITTDVGYPILGNIRTGDFKTVVQSADYLKTTGKKDPREADIGTWFTIPESLLDDQDEDASAVAVDGVFSMTKVTEGKTFALYREEPALLRSNSDGFALNAKVVADNENLEDASTGTGFIIFDGQTVFQLALFNDFATKTIGLLKRSGSLTDINDHFLPTTPIDWSVTGFRLVVEPRASEIRLYATSDLATPAMTIPFDRDDLPTAAHFGWGDETPFIAFGHIMPSDTKGTFDLEHFEFCHLFQVWEGSSGVAPTDSETDPAFDVDAMGPEPGAEMDGDIYRVTVPTGTVCKFSREAPFSPNRGGAIEVRVRVTASRTGLRTGTYFLLDDGNHCYALTFVDTAVGKFVSLALASGIGFAELAGKDGRAATLSFPVDWSEFHTYRIERRTHDGVQVFLDEETTPRITFPETSLEELPQEQFDGTPSIAFGNFTTEGSTSEWAFVHGLFSGGFEISFKKNKPDSVLREELFDTQAIIVAYALDADA